ncbi:hypothetical protein CPAST_c04780 [Clostridium pasteurianum DSM 525 = ATCC 6013]|uniref:Uncharacterized protein n=1 Tax=Clostridium pasteurianum DSM 525 = ATCC 6013 TaxID=1262449 RepID=A0A0H3J3U0_CLOPA|nr:hypothetical protein [Clostridium pasteurianum]AJA46578.1 hypothetical protein CPAST_c04780 [Clostridium pasteurianum DSM 525 = ATCC 6013]AJA50566.1 hypothetical protein CLPA_c04780 [Clostridium pasteurianum DSM 525 = ATCC 6013]KRU13422.1 hypothetical protein CP6013_02670 [Clostridium pasteurianum DSM 525 = ATCC 6013]
MKKVNVKSKNKEITEINKYEDILEKLEEKEEFWGCGANACYINSTN